MASQAQLLANRRNAQRSTGPRSVEGKSVSRFNALKTGIRAKSEVIPGEDPAELDQLASDYHLQFRPASPVERFFVDALVDAEWQLRRLHQIEARLWEHSLAPDTPDLGQAYDAHLQAFTRLHRRIEAVERSYYKALQQLQRLQAEATEAPDEEIGFVCPSNDSDLAVEPPRPEEALSPRTVGSGMPVPGRASVPQPRL